MPNPALAENKAAFAGQAADFPWFYFNQWIDALPAAAYLCDGKGNVACCNHAAQLVAGRRPSPTDRWGFFSGILDPEKKTPVNLEDWLEAGGQYTPKSRNVILERPDGTSRTVEISIQAFHNPDGEPTCTLVSLKEVPPTLIERDQFFLRLFQALPLAVYTCDHLGYVTYFNDFAVRLWGRTPVIGSDLWSGSWKILTPEGEPIPLDECPMAIAIREQKEVAGEEIMILRPDGEKRYVFPLPTPLFDDQGKLSGGVNLLLDISELKSTEEKIAHLASIVESSHDAIISKSLEGIVKSWNGSAEKIFGYQPSEMIGQSILKIIPGDRKGEEATILSRIQKGERVTHFETFRLTKDNRLRDISLTISPVRNRQGKIIGASKIARDITEEKAAARAQREKEDFLRMAVKFTGLGTFDYLPDQDSLTWSEECRRLFDASPKDRISLEDFLGHIHPQDEPRVRETILNLLGGGGSGIYDFSFRIIRQQSSETRWVRAQGKVYCSENGKVERLIGTIMDNTDEKASKEILEKLVRERTVQLTGINDQLEKFAYAASHDLQEPLRKMQTFSQLVKANLNNPELAERYCGKIQSAALRMSNLITSMLTYSRLSQSEYEFSEVDLNQVLQEARADFEIGLLEKKASVRFANLPRIRGIQSQIYQLFSNLISNSIKFCDRPPEIRVDFRDLDPEDQIHNPNLHPDMKYVELLFTDNGIGFEKQYAEQIFIIFQRLHSPEVYSGTGIGLTMCKKIVENHYGSISAESQPGVGSTFRIILPRFA